jgi:hypothetical protein
MKFNKTVKLQSTYPQFTSNTAVINFSISDITTVVFDTSEVEKNDGTNLNVGLLKTVAYYGDNVVEYIPNQFNVNTNTFEPPSSFEHIYYVVSENSNLLGKVEFLYKNGNTSTVFLSVFTSQSNNIDLELYTANNQSFFTNGEVKELINLTNYDNTLYSLAYTPTPLYKFDKDTGGIEFFTLSGFEGNYLTTDDGTPIILQGFSYNNQFISVV